jgi:predicted  nucleic acid-binding Zn-ribbon protein
MENKITDEQLKTIQDQQQQLNKLITDIGFMETQKHALLHEIAQVNKEVEQVKEILEKEYGAININLETGTYTDIEVPEEVANV